MMNEREERAEGSESEGFEETHIVRFAIEALLCSAERS